MYDYCIIGGGPAGLVLSKYLLRNNATEKIILLDAGGVNSLNEKAAEFISQGKTYYKPFHQFQLGGHGHLWGGACPRLHPNDFKMKSLYGLYQDWPVQYDELIPYYEKAEKLLQVEVSKNELLQDTKDPFVEHIKHSELNGSLPYGNRDYFVSDLLPEILNSGIKIKNNSVVRKLQPITGGGVTVHYFSEEEKQNIKVKAKNVILCTGGLSNARLLQLSLPEMFPDGVGHIDNSLGKYFMDHPRLSLELEKNRLKGQQETLLEGVIPTTISKNISTVDHDIAFASLSIARTITPILGMNSINKIINNYSIEQWQEQLKNKISAVEHITMDIEAMDPPMPQNTIGLANKLDVYGDPMLATNINISQVRKNISNKVIDLIGKSLENHGFLLSDFKQSAWTGQHPSGSTRMSDTAKNGVVDKNLKVYGVEGIYVLGSSVFPTIGYANPTLTIVALTLRLSDYLSSKNK